ncbi:hypothetical protein HPG69_005916, partial [Diceros bicornis minor]
EGQDIPILEKKDVVGRAGGSFSPYVGTDITIMNDDTEFKRTLLSVRGAYVLLKHESQNEKRFLRPI